MSVQVAEKTFCRGGEEGLEKQDARISTPCSPFTPVFSDGRVCLAP